MRCICWDLDGTLADHRHRKHLVEGPNPDYEAFIAQIPYDQPNADVVFMYHHFRAMPEVKTLIVTNRPLRAIQNTIIWCNKHNIIFNDIYMRDDDDYGGSASVKEKSLQKLRSDGYNPIFAVDDKSSVVDMWRSNGVTCLQCAPGNYE